MAELEQWVLDGLALNDVTYVLESVSDPPAQKKPEWISGADSDGAVLGRKPTHENKVIEMRVRVAQQATMDLALAKIAAVLDKAQECSHNVNGSALAWTPADGTKTLTARCLLAEITDIPKDWQDSGWFVRSPVFTLRLTCLPFWEGVEYLAGSVTNADPIVSVEVASVPGDVPALGRLVVTDAASQSRRYVAWGLESRHYRDVTPLIVDSAAMVTMGFAGVTTTRTGAYSGVSSNVISATLRTQVQAICGLENHGHIGSYRPHLRFYASATTMAVRLTFQALDGPLRSLSYRVPVAVGWNFVDLGLVSIPEAGLGTQRWTGRLEAYSTASGGETFEADVMLMIPAEAYGRARGSYSYTAGPLVAYDYFTAMTSGTALGGTVADSGATWATSGATTDFAAADAPALTDEAIVRTTSSDTAGGRFAVLGATNYTDTEVSVRTYALTVNGQFHVGARYVDASNYLEAGWVPSQYGEYFWVSQKVAGTTTYLGGRSTADAVLSGPQPTALWRQLRLVVFASGRGIVDLLDSSGGLLHRFPFMSADLAAGGVLATGKPFIRDYPGGPLQGPQGRYYDDFTVATPGAEPIALYSGQSLEVRHDTTLREDATGVYAGSPPEYVGSRFYVPNAGGPARKSRVAVVARRNDVVVNADNHIADSTTVQVFVVPRYLAVPR